MTFYIYACGHHLKKLISFGTGGLGLSYWSCACFMVGLKIFEVEIFVDGQSVNPVNHSEPLNPLGSSSGTGVCHVATLLRVSCTTHKVVNWLSPSSQTQIEVILCYPDGWRRHDLSTCFTINLYFLLFVTNFYRLTFRLIFFCYKFYVLCIYHEQTKRLN